LEAPKYKYEATVMAVWVWNPQRGPGAEPLVMGSEGEDPVKLKHFWLLDIH